MVAAILWRLRKNEQSQTENSGILIVKNHSQSAFKSVSAGLCLLVSLLASDVRAFTTWDPQGTTGANPVTTSLSGTW